MVETYIGGPSNQTLVALTRLRLCMQSHAGDFVSIVLGYVAGGGIGMRGGAVCHSSAISAGVRAQAWLTRSLSVRSKLKVSAARAWAGSMVRVCNPNGIESSSPGLRAASYPGKMGPGEANPNGVATTALRLRPQPRWG